MPPSRDIQLARPDRGVASDGALREIARTRWTSAADEPPRSTDEDLHGGRDSSKLAAG